MHGVKKIEVIFLDFSYCHKYINECLFNERNASCKCRSSKLLKSAFS